MTVRQDQGNEDVMGTGSIPAVPAHPTPSVQDTRDPRGTVELSLGSGPCRGSVRPLAQGALLDQVPA